MDMEKAGPRDKRARGSDVDNGCLSLFWSEAQGLQLLDTVLMTVSGIQRALSTCPSPVNPNSHLPCPAHLHSFTPFRRKASCLGEWCQLLAGTENYLFNTLFSPFSWRTLYHLLPPPPLSSFSSNYYQRQLNLKVRSLERESQIHLSSLPRDLGQVTWPLTDCLTRSLLCKHG